MKIFDNKHYAPAYLLVILRIYLGIILLYTVYGKLGAPTPFSKEMLGFLNYVIKAKIPAAFYVHFIQSTVIPNASLFSYLVMTAELIAALCFLSGALTRVAALIAMILFINYMFAKGAWFWSPNSEDAAVFFIALVIFLGRAGRLFGVDQHLAKKWPKSVLW
jgi:uncharacterized membrane protein YphA (DoxX/SURF4 family)